MISNDKFLEHFKEIKCESSDTHGFNYFDFLHILGSPIDALFYSRLFWPDFIDFKEMVFLKEYVEDDNDISRIEVALNQYNGDKTATEKSFNLIEVPSLFGKSMSATTDEEDRLLAEQLSEMWLNKLNMTFVDREFAIEVLSPNITGGEIAVCFYTKREK